MCLQDGYKLFRARELTAALAALNARQISFRAFRAYVAGHELIARREAAERVHARKSPQRRFLTSELAAVMDEGSASLSRELRALARAGLMTFTESTLALSPDAAQSVELLKLLGSRGGDRLVPVPRQVLKFLARCSRPALAKTVVAYLLRGLALSRTGELQAAGTVKVSWICKLGNISERAARAARAELIRLGWITRDTGSVQRKLNRDGAYFVINTRWRRAEQRSAPLRAEKCARNAPLREKQETPSDLKYQKPAPRPGTGVLRTERKPDLRNIQPEDIRRISQLRELFRQATEVGWIERGEAAFLNFAAAAVRANRVGREPVRAFVAIVRKRLWHHLSVADEEQAICSLRRLSVRSEEWVQRERSATSGSLRELLGTMKIGGGKIRIGR